MSFDTEEYPSPAEGIGLENRQGCKSPRGFESLFLLHTYKYNERQTLKSEDASIFAFLRSKVYKEYL